MKKCLFPIFSFLLAVSVCSAESGEVKHGLSDSTFFIENICGTDSGYVLYPGTAWRSYVANKYIRPTFNDLLSAVSELPSNTKIVFGCLKGVNQYADPKEIKKRTGALQKSCRQARIECVAQQVASGNAEERRP